MIRHGQASFGKDDYDRLSETGTRQCEVLGKYLCDIGIKIDAVYSGSLERQKNSASIVAGEFSKRGIDFPQCEILEGLNEYNTTAVMKKHLPLMIDEDPSISKEMEQFFTDTKIFRKIFGEAVLRWINDTGKYENFESRTAFKKRVMNAFEHAQNKNKDKKNIFIFSSGGAITASIQNFLELSGEKTMELGWRIANASITRFSDFGDILSLHSFNSFQHLEQEDKKLVTYR